MSRPFARTVWARSRPHGRRCACAGYGATPATRMPLWRRCPSPEPAVAARQPYALVFLRRGDAPRRSCSTLLRPVCVCLRRGPAAPLADSFPIFAAASGKDSSARSELLVVAVFAGQAFPVPLTYNRAVAGRPFPAGFKIVQHGLFRSAQGYVGLRHLPHADENNHTLK